MFEEKDSDSRKGIELLLIAAMRVFTHLEGRMAEKEMVTLEDFTVQEGEAGGHIAWVAGRSKESHFSL